MPPEYALKKINICVQLWLADALRGCFGFDVVDPVEILNQMCD
jgi:hypothetical protein